ncbi:MAG: hypothetical protein KGL53_10305, partial [Elusimicrobia bacterium]|nr:hypothetical protein [Elusimicrobiota bacterium]
MRLGFLLLALLAPGRAFAGAYFQQAAFPLAASSVTAVDRDLLGNLYVLGASSGAYSVTEYATPGMTPLFSFAVPVSSPVAFAVEGSGIVDILDASGTTATLRRYQNTGAPLGSTTYDLSATVSATQPLISAVIDKVKQLVYFGYQQYSGAFCVQCLGCACPPPTDHGGMDQYDFSGNLLNSFMMPGNSGTSGSCYTPSILAVDPQSDVLVADNLCQQVLKFSSAGSQVGDFTAASWTDNYLFTARGMWTDQASDIYISQPVCGAAGCKPGIVKLDPSAQLVTSFISDSPQGGAWDPRVLYVSSGGRAPLLRYVYDGAPTVPGEASPIGPVVQHSSSAALSWQRSTDPDGDSVQYLVSVGTSPTALASIGATADAGLATAPLAFGTTYFWQVSAQDWYAGMPLLATPAPVVSFTQALQNSPPGAFSVLTGTGIAVTRSTSVRLSWTAAVDPDGDPVVYDVLWQAPGEASLALAGSTDQTVWQVSGLTFGATYYWSVRARDVYDAATLLEGGAPQAYHLVFQNTPPPAPGIVGGTGTLAEHTETPSGTLAWSPVADPDGDPVAYRLYLGADPAALPLVADSTATSYALSGSLGTTYYWEVASYDPYSASTTAVQSLLFTLQDNPPYPVAYLSPSTLTTRATSYALAWEATGDPDGDPVTYDLYLSTDPSRLPQVQSGPGTSFNLDFAFGTTYYWRVSAVDDFGERADGAGQTFLPVFRDTPPPAPTVLSGAGTVSEHTLTPSATLAWSSVTDADGDPVSYRLALGTSPAEMGVVQDGQGLSYTLSPAFGTTYYWQATAYDPYASSATAVERLVVDLQNAPPAPFSVTSGSGTVFTRASSLLLSWQDAVDPDGDAVTYDLAVSTTAGVWPLVQSSQATSFTLPVTLGTTYYWKVTARDGFGGTTSSGPQTLLPLFLNHPPTAPVDESQTGTVAFHGFSPSQPILWGPSTDPDGDAVTYSLALGTDPARLAVVDPASSGYTPPGIPLDATYYFRITATDSYGASTASPTDWVYYRFVNAAPGPFAAVAGTTTVVTRDTSDLLAWTASVDPDGDPVTYRVYSGTAPAAMTELGETSGTMLTLPGMAFGTTYFWEATAYDGFGGTTPVSGGVQSLSHVFYDPPPSPLVYLSTASVYAEHTASPSVTLAWEPSTNAAGDPITYRLDVQTSTGAWPSIDMGSGTSLAFDTLFETTYTWRVAAEDPYGGASTGPWTSFIVHLANQPPTPIVYTTPATLVTRATATTLGWDASADPDGDAVTYALYLSTSAAGQALVQQGPQTGYALRFQYGTTYYWRVTARDSFGAETAGALQTFVATFQNSPPPAPTVLGGTGSVGEHTLSPSATLSWGAVADPDGDPVAYRLALGTSPAALAAVQDGTATAYALPAPAFGTRYYWQVTAYDPYGGAGSTGEQELSLFLKNSPPGQFDVHAGTGTLATRASTQE